MRDPLVARLVDLFWLIAPEFHHEGLAISWMDIVLPLTLRRSGSALPGSCAAADSAGARPAIRRGARPGARTCGRARGPRTKAMAHSHSSHDQHTVPTGSVEPDYVNIRSVFGFGIGLFVVATVVHLLMLWMWSVEVANVDAANPPRVYPLAVLQDERQPPEPRLQTSPKADLADLRAYEDHVLNGYSWVDRNNDIVRIPVADAMRLTLQRGLPSRPQPGGDGAGQAAAAATNVPGNIAATQERK